MCRCLLALLASLGACQPRPAVRYDPLDSTGGTGAGPTAVAQIVGLEDPESVRYDADQDVFFISNMFGYGSAKDGVGYITRVPAGDLDQVQTFVEGGRNGVTLDAPKGMAIVGDTLWVTDIDVVRGFDKRSGRSVGTIDFRPMRPTMLNDIAAGPDGTLRVTDTGIIMSDKGVVYRGGDRVYEVDAQHRIRVIAAGPQLGRPNGIAWDARGNRWLMVSFAPFGSAMTALSGDARQVLVDGPGKFDGVEALADGRVLYTCWNDSSVHVFQNGSDRRLIRNLPTPADIGVDTRRARVAVPLSAAGRVEVWSLGTGSGAL